MPFHNEIGKFINHNINPIKLSTIKLNAARIPFLIISGKFPNHAKSLITPFHAVSVKFPYHRKHPMRVSVINANTARIPFHTVIGK